MKTILTLLTVCAILMAATTANGAFTPISPSPGPEPSLLTSGGILDTLYGLTNLVRIEDTPFPGDQVWMNLDGGVTAEAKWAWADEAFGYIPGSSGGSFVTLFTVPITPDGYLSGYSGNIPSSVPIFRLGLHASNPLFDYGLKSSQESDNAGQDNMVTWLITGGPSAGNYVVAWECEGLGDADYQDLVVEISNAAPIPAPGAILLGSIGVGLVGWLRRRRSLFEEAKTYKPFNEVRTLQKGERS